MLSSAIITSFVAASSFATVQASLLPRQDQSLEQIKFGGRCLASTESPSNGTPLELADCDSSSNLQLWSIAYGNNPSVELGNTGYCIDATENPSYLGTVHMWTCYPGLYQQQWYLTGSNRIAITGGTMCLAYRDRITTTDCTYMNDAQAWNLGGDVDADNDGGAAATVTDAGATGVITNSAAVSVVSVLSTAVAAETDTAGAAYSSLASELSTAAAGLTGGVVIGNGAAATSTIASITSAASSAVSSISAASDAESTIASITSAASSLVSSVSGASIVNGATVIDGSTIVATDTVVNTISTNTVLGSAALSSISQASASISAISSAIANGDTSGAESMMKTPSILLALGAVALPFLL